MQTSGFSFSSSNALGVRGAKLLAVNPQTAAHAGRRVLALLLGDGEARTIGRVT